MNKDIHDRATDEAANWFVRAQTSELSDSDRAAFAQWLTASAEHVREYLACASLSINIRSVGTTPDVDELVRASRDPDIATNVVPLQPESADRLKGGGNTGYSRILSARLMWPSGVAVGLIWAVLLLVIAITSPAQYSTGIGEQVSFRLSDGSVVTLNAYSKIQVNFSDRLRRVQLLQGEALFHVSKDPTRPFQVHTDQAVVRAIGTIFDVRNRNNVTTVTVVEGAIDVKASVASDATAEDSRGNAASAPPTRVVTGEQVEVASMANQVVPQPDANIESALAWRERRITFSSKPLFAVAEEFNLYNEDRIVIVDSALANRLVSGAFSVDDQQSFVLFLSEAGIADYEMRSDGSYLLRDSDR